MDPSGNDNSRGSEDARDAQRRLRLMFLQQQRQRGGALRYRTERPDEALISMSNNDYGQGRVQVDMGVAAAAPNADLPAAEARSRSSEVDNIKNVSDRDNPNFRELLQLLREFCGDGGSKSPHAGAIDMEKARNVLEACAGNVGLAVQLYWDDYFASQPRQPDVRPMDAPSAAEPAEEAGDPAEEERRVRRRLENDFEALLPNDFESLLPAARPENPAPDVARALPRRRRRRRRGPDADGEVGGLVAPAVDNGRHNVEEDLPVADVEPARPPARPPQRPPHRPHDNQDLFVAARAVLGAGDDAAEGSASVSDDEAGVAGVLRMVRASGRARLRGRRRRHSSNFDNLDLVQARNALNAEIQAGKDDQKMDTERAKIRTASGAGGGDGGDESSDGEDSSVGKDSNKNFDDADAYLSDNDWLFTAASRSATTMTVSTNNTQSVENLRAPLSVLWNGLTDSRLHEEIKKTANDLKQDTDNFEDGGCVAKGTKVDPKSDGKGGEIDSSGDNDINPPNPVAAKRPEIPSTWLFSSFSAHSTAMGLAVKEPKLEDVAEHSWRLHQLNNDVPVASNIRRNNTVPLPYHCRGITAILSIVTAAIYTGASVQSNQVTCSSPRVPFLELSEEQRKREFDSRLIDALSALIFIAAKASMERKKKALDKRQAQKCFQRKRRKKTKDSSPGDEEDTEVPDVLQRILERKLKLCPVVWWKQNQSNVPTTPAEQWENSLDSDAAHTGPRIQVNVSYGTNMHDIRAFVLSNMHSFTCPGGLALLLETIVGIHGEGAVKRMLRQSRNASKHHEQSPCFLVRCTCEGRQKKRLQDSSLSPATRRKMTSSLDTTPPGHECVSTELISLLLTGKIHSSLNDCTASPLGFGVLSNKPGEVGRVLSRPELPVWCVKGETCFSVLLLDYTNHGDNLDEKPAEATSKGNGKLNALEKAKYLSHSKPKATPCMKIAVCSSTSRSRDLQEARAFANEELPGFVANIAHWNPWFGLRNLSGLRLITARSNWVPPTPSWVVAAYKSAHNANHTKSIACGRRSIAQQLKERRASKTNIVSCDEQDKAVSERPLDEASMERIRLHPDDAKFYPKQHRLWRFDMGEVERGAVDSNSKPRGDHWVPYHSLSLEEQMTVEAKFGPQINRIIWTRWPGATIDKFTPEGKNEPLPIV